MSDEKPFVRLSEPFDGLRPLWFGNANPVLGMVSTPVGCGFIACAVNGQGSARERKAAAKALREAADSAVQDAEWKGVTEKTYTSHQMAQWLRTLADLAEKGER